MKYVYIQVWRVWVHIYGAFVSLRKGVLCSLKCITLVAGKIMKLKNYRLERAFWHGHPDEPNLCHYSPTAIRLWCSNKASTMHNGSQ